MDGFRLRDESGVSNFGMFIFGCLCGIPMMALLGGPDIVGKAIFGRYWPSDELRAKSAVDCLPDCSAAANS